METLENEKLRKYLHKKYYKNDRKIITIHIEDEAELYNSLDSAKDTLSNDVTSYLERTAMTILPLNNIEIKVDCKSKIDLKNFEKCLHIHYAIENLNSERIERLEWCKSIFLLSVGIITFITFFFMDSLYEVRYFITTLAIWEYIDMKIYKDDREEIKKYIYELLDEATVN